MVSPVDTSSKAPSPLFNCLDAVILIVEYAEDIRLSKVNRSFREATQLLKHAKWRAVQTKLETTPCLDLFLKNMRPLGWENSRAELAKTSRLLELLRNRERLWKGNAPKDLNFQKLYLAIIKVCGKNFLKASLFAENMFSESFYGQLPKNLSLHSLWKQLRQDLLSAGACNLPGLDTSPDTIRNWLNNPENSPAISRVTEFCIKGWGITEIPEELGKFTELKKLTIISSISNIYAESFRGLTRLRTLDLRGNCIKILPQDVLQHLPQLIYLDLRENPIPNNPPISLPLPPLPPEIEQIEEEPEQPVLMLGSGDLSIEGERVRLQTEWGNHIGMKWSQLVGDKFYDSYDDPTPEPT